MASSDPQRDVCIIGCGISGLVAAKEVREMGFRPHIFEFEDTLGGVFNSSTKAGRVYDNCYLTVSSRFMYMSSMPAARCIHLHHSGFLQHMHDFAREYDLLGHVSFKKRITSVKRLEPKKWRVVIEDLVSGESTTRFFCAVAICCGTHQVARILTKEQVPGLETFTGKVLHTHDYKNAESASLKGKRVVSIGCGESGADIITECSGVASEMLMSLRSYPFIVPRQFDRNHVTSTDSHLTPLGFLSGLNPVPVLFRPVKAVINLSGVFACLGMAIVQKLLGVRGEVVDSFGQKVSKDKKYMDRGCEVTKQNYELMHSWAMLGDCNASNKFATKNASFVPAITSGKLQVNASGIAKVDGSTIIFKDGRSFQKCDVLLMCTGYKDTFPFLEDKEFVPDSSLGVRALYCHAFHPDPTITDLAFIGYARPSVGGIPLCSELVARFWALLLSGQRELPADISTRAAQEALKENQTFHLSPAIKSVVHWGDFISKLTKHIGCMPKLSTIYWYGGLRSLYAVFTSNPVPHVFRFNGPGAMPELAAKNVLQSVGSISPFHGAQLAFKNALADLGLNRLYAYTFTGSKQREASWDYMYRFCGVSTLTKPMAKYAFVNGA